MQNHAHERMNLVIRERFGEPAGLDETTQSGRQQTKASIMKLLKLGADLEVYDSTNELTATIQIYADNEARLFNRIGKPVGVYPYDELANMLFSRKRTVRRR